MNPSAFNVTSFKTNTSTNTTTPATKTPLPAPVVQPYNPPATTTTRLSTVTPSASTVVTPSSFVDVPKKISSDTLNYKAPQGQDIIQPYDSSHAALISTVDTHANQVNTPPTPISERDQLIKDRQTSFDIYNNKDTGYAATSAKLQQESGGVLDSQNKIRQFNVQDEALQRQGIKFAEDTLTKNPQGVWGTAGQQLIDQNNRALTSQRADIAIQKLTAQGDLEGATNLVKLKLDAQFSPIKERMDFIEKSLTINGNDMSESQKSQATKELYQLKEQEGEKKVFDKMAAEAQQNGATKEEVNNASLLYSNGDKTGANAVLAKYGSSGSLTPAQINSTVSSIAGAFDNEPIVKGYNIISEGAAFANSIAKKANPTSSDDQGLVYAFAKAMDPNSAVKEGEYITVQKYNQSLIQQGWASAKRIVANEAFLTVEARNNMTATINSRFEASKIAYKNTSEQYQRQIDDAYAGKNRRITNYDTSSKNNNEVKGDSIIQTKVGPVTNSWFK